MSEWAIAGQFRSVMADCLGQTPHSTGWMAAMGRRNQSGQKIP